MKGRLILLVNAVMATKFAGDIYDYPLKLGLYWKLVNLL